MLLWGFLLLPRLPRLEYRYNTERGYLVLPASLLVSPIDWHVLAFDWRGWAESSTHRSYASGFSVFETWGRETLRLAT